MVKSILSAGQLPCNEIGSKTSSNIGIRKSNNRLYAIKTDHCFQILHQKLLTRVIAYQRWCHE
ncbi:MAG: hypothetical protein WCH10_02945 [bacterium]